jgi:hypothetical protein
MTIKLIDIDKMTELDFGMSTLNKITLHNGTVIYISYINGISNGVMNCEQNSECIFLNERKIQSN